MLVSQLINTVVAPIFNNRIWPNAAPEDAGYPFMVYTESTSEKLNTIDEGFINHCKNRVQMYVFSKDYSEVKTLKDQIIAAMQNQTDIKNCLPINDQYQFETQTQSHLIVIEYSLWEQSA